MRSRYGLHPAPSDAWDHAIKAVGAVLIPMVVPKQTDRQARHHRCRVLIGDARIGIGARDKVGGAAV